MEPIKIIFDNCLSKVCLDNGYTETIFDDHTSVPALPQYNFVNIKKAEELGYKGNCKIMTVHHELLHTFLAEEVGLEYSPSLWAIAHQFIGPSCISMEERWKEEALILSFQKYINTREIELPVDIYIKTYHLNLRRLRQRACQLIEFTYDEESLQ